jgi:hypothetical protein
MIDFAAFSTPNRGKVYEYYSTLRIFAYNNSIKFFIIYVPSQQPKGQLQTQHSLDTGNYIIDKHKLQASIVGRKI